MHFSVFFFFGRDVARKQTGLKNTGMKISLSGQWQQHAFKGEGAMIYINFSFV